MSDVIQFPTKEEEGFVQIVSCSNCNNKTFRIVLDERFSVECACCDTEIDLVEVFAADD